MKKQIAVLLTAMFVLVFAGQAWAGGFENVMKKIQKQAHVSAVENQILTNDKEITENGKIRININNAFLNIVREPEKYIIRHPNGRFVIRLVFLEEISGDDFEFQYIFHTDGKIDGVNISGTSVFKTGFYWSNNYKLGKITITTTNNNKYDFDKEDPTKIEGEKWII